MPPKKSGRNNFNRNQAKRTTRSQYGNKHTPPEDEQMRTGGNQSPRVRQGRNRQPSSGYVAPSSMRRAEGQSRNKRQARRRRHRNRPETSADVPSSSTGSQENSAGSLEIPGFYFDAEKKKYFKILPSQAGIQGAVTEQSIKSKIAEKKRQEDLMEIGKNLAFAFVQEHDETALLRRPPFRMPKFSSNVFSLLERTKSAHFVEKFRTPKPMNQEIIKHSVARLKPAGKLKIFENPFTSYEKLEHMLHMKVNEEQDKILCLWGLREQIVQRIQMLNVNGINRYDSDGSVDIDILPTGASVLQSFSKVTDMCWATLNGADPLDCCILYTTTCFLGNNPSLALLRRLDADSPQNLRHAEFNLGQKATWACAWNGKRNQLSVGSEGCALLLDVPTRRTWELHTGNSDVRSQTFLTQGEPALFSGTKKGIIFGHDLRTTSSRAAVTLKQRSTVCHLKFATNTNYLFAADFSGRIKQWDLRQRKVVLEFQGQNQYSRTPFHIDSTETVICAAGEDCYTRLWDIRDGRLLTSIPPPHPASRETIPASHLFTLPCNTVRQPGLLMGSRDELHFYSFHQ